MENHLFDNKGDGTFEEIALLANVAYGTDGDARGSMGAEVADVNGDGKFDLFVPDFTLKCLYINQGGGLFEDRARQAGIAIPCSRYVSWGAVVVGPGSGHRLGHLSSPTAMPASSRDAQPGVPQRRPAACSPRSRSKWGSPSCRGESAEAWPRATWTTTATWICS